MEDFLAWPRGSSHHSLFCRQNGGNPLGEQINVDGELFFYGALFPQTPPSIAREEGQGYINVSTNPLFRECFLLEIEPWLCKVYNSHNNLILNNTG